MFSPLNTALSGLQQFQDQITSESTKKAAAQKLADGVKEQCLKRPEDCLAVAKTVGAGLSALDKAR